MNNPCDHCGLSCTIVGHDACLGVLPDVWNACCGHGRQSASYIDFKNGVRVTGFKVGTTEGRYKTIKPEV